MLSERDVQANETTVDRYTDQPARMPKPVRDAVERSWGGAPVELYALADLDASMKLARVWVALGPEHVALATERDGCEAPEVTNFERARVTGTRTAPGLSCTVTTILGDAGGPPLAVLRYTHRQRRAVENVTFVLEQALEGRGVPGADADEVYAEAVADPVRSAQASVNVNKLSVLWRLLGYLRPYRRRVAIGLGAAAIMTSLALVPPYLTGYLIDKVFRPYQVGTLAHADARRAAWIVLAVIAGIYLLREACGWVRLRTMSILGEDVARDLRAEVYEHLQELSLAYYSRVKTGSIISRVTSDTDRLWHFIAMGVVDVSLAAVMLVGLATVLILLDWRLGLVMVVPVPLLLGALMRHSGVMRRIFLRAWRKWSGLTGLVADSVAGIRVVKAFHQEERQKARFKETNDDAAAEFRKIHLVWTGFWPRLMIAFRGLIIVVWAIAIPLVLALDVSGPGALTIGTFVSFLLYMGMFFYPIDVIGQMTHMLNRATSSAHRIFEVLDTRPEIAEPIEAVRVEPLEGRVTFENVTFAYDGVRQVVRGISFDVNPGEMIGLVGPSGAGKTTVINLIARFYDATGGSVRIDGVDVRDLDAESFRRQVGMVLQDSYLFHGTVLENVRYGAPEATTAEVIAAARAANAHDFVCKMPNGYDTMVGERGHTLSGGERQRISIARAILKDPRILILDEATSSVDTETEHKIQEALERLIPGRTVFAIAHRLSTLKRADRLLVIEDGKVSEHGTHADLLRRPRGTYRKLHDLQSELHKMHAA